MGAVGVNSIHIAGSKTCNDWRVDRASLAIGSTPELWKTVAKEYFEQRVALRYLRPIEWLQKEGTYQGEGFSIVAIQMTLIEFLESTVRGVNYRFLRKGQQLAPFEYNRSGDVFVSFLTQREPFRKEFNEALGQDFYESVRCGLLHEAQTKNGWTIWAKSSSGSLIDGTLKIVYRDNFQTALLKFVEWYKTALPTDTALQEALLRKFDYLCS